MLNHYDAALVHLYGYLPYSMRTKLVLDAAIELLKAGIVENFVFVSRSALGSKEPWSTAAANEFIRMTNIKKGHVFTNPTAPPTTNQELKFLRKTAQKQNWSNVLSIGCETHRQTIKTLAKRTFKNGVNFNFKSAEEILQTYSSSVDQKKYQQMIDALHKSDGEKKFARYESGFANKFKLHFPFGPEILDVVACFYRPRVD